MPVISLIGAKGGSTKTATALSLAAGALEAGLRVALVDCDPQHSATTALPRRMTTPEGGTTEVAHEDVTDPLTADPVTIEFDEVAGSGGHLVLYRGGRGLITASPAEIRRHVGRAAGDADLVIVDTLPAIGAITIAVMERSDLVVIPTEATADALNAVSGVVAAAERVVPAHAQVRLLLARVDRRQRIVADAVKYLEERYPGRLYGTWIPDDVRAKEAAWYLRPVVLYDPHCRAARAYRDLTAEVLGDLGLRPSATAVGGGHAAP